MRTHGPTADLHTVAALLLIAISALFVFGALSDDVVLRPLLRISCHRLPQRSFSWAPGLCARCTFFWSGSLAASVLMLFRRLPGSIRAGILMILPLAIDGTVQYFFPYTSTNPVRLVTGAAAGAGMCVFLSAGLGRG